MDFPGHFEQIFQQLNYQRLHGQLCDCVIVVGNRHFKAHRSVLAACSTHFRALFTVAEGDQTMNMIQLDSDVVTAEAFAALIDMMYTSTLMLGESNVMDVLLAASHLHLNSVVKACKHYLTTRTLPMSPPSDRVQEQNARVQRSFMLQQLGLSIVSSALNSTQSTEEQPNTMSSLMRSNIEQRTTFPIRRLHKRKQSSDDRARQRIRPTIDESISDVTPESGQSVVHSREDFFSPDSLKIVDNSKADAVTDKQENNTIMFDQSFSAQEDVQVPSQSDNSGGNISQISVASQMLIVDLIHVIVSLMKMLSRTDPRIDLCSTPLVTSLQSLRTSLDRHDLSKMIESILPVTSASSLSTLGCIPSGPMDLYGAKISQEVPDLTLIHCW
ncbi:zinc finger and BTB domain-containing protein 5-like isoform X2 [Dromaius novaehollandiae]|uniref:zinc finger and BTB domain-containing protein 5-like isoform X2 n=1 Tax=Dromaius novaehollandiae TaxID=8790 RepID=UPI00311F89CB